MDWHDIATAAAAFLLPPGLFFLPLLAAGLCAALRRRGAAAVLLLLSLAGFWFGATPVLAHALLQAHLSQLQPLTSARVAQAALPPHATAVVVLGMGEVLGGEEYGEFQLNPEGYERLRYGLYLSRQYGWPVLYSGGVGPLAQGSAVGDAPAAEARVAQRIAQTEFKAQLRWLELGSFTVHDSARLSAAMLARAGITHIVLVAHGWKLPRAKTEFEAAGLSVTAAPIGISVQAPTLVSDWVPTSEGQRWVRNVVRERYGLWRAAWR